MFRLLSIVVVALLLCARPSAAEFSSYVIIRDDASLLIRNNVVRLFGVYIPRVNQAAAALNFAIHGFVTCQEMDTYDDGSIGAYCWTRATDLGAYLIRNGLALAGPDAPFDYHAMERIARSNGLGIWGFQVDQFRRFIIPPGFTLSQRHRPTRLR
jgi:endonuclease YncB( thermonuclease family)